MRTPKSLPNADKTDRCRFEFAGVSVPVARKEIFEASHFLRCQSLM